ncbi:hypothetical protein D9758_008822 [Tetrapyrgos nigripes]|uniref:Metal homeostatis protein bsd2 n=1 Tax=Tetrapyrgos nigripes TaxID=182062 RepID=A0A8H5CLX1_9AGAR|nr:hypothetical protein D9758_008822 [Tetrapyrgos nigripes]
MSNRYAPLPNPRSDEDARHEMEAAFDDSDDEDDIHNTSESQPLTSSHTRTTSTVQPTSNRIPGTYDFENVDYDYPPPGSPPAPSEFALPNNHGNSNGLIPTFEVDSSRTGPRRNWFQRTLTRVLPSRYQERLGYAAAPTGAVGGGTNNDGVFANVTAKPSRPVTITEGDETYVVPEDSQNEAPPSYSSAQADAVPPYWETTVHAPFSPDSVGEMIIDSLPTGSLFSFLWNMLVSISFQFVGFLLTYLLHTTHAARLGSRAGLGITLIQYGFALRARLEGRDTDTDNSWENQPWTDDGTGRPHFPTAAESSGWHMNNTSTGPTPTAPTPEEQASMMVADATTEWLSFFLMTVGWFILLTSLLGFWRVKRWERGILASQQSNNSSSQQGSTGLSQFEQTFGLRGVAPGDFFRQGFGFGSSRDAHDVEAQTIVANDMHDPGEHQLAATLPHDDPNRARILAEALANERRLQNDLRAAGLL